MAPRPRTRRASSASSMDPQGAGGQGRQADDHTQRRDQDRGQRPRAQGLAQRDRMGRHRGRRAGNKKGDTIEVAGALRHRSFAGEDGIKRKVSSIECQRFQVLERAQDLAVAPQVRRGRKGVEQGM